MADLLILMVLMSGLIIEFSAAQQPTGQPSGQPTSQPSSRPTQPTGQPSGQPTGQPTSVPTSIPASKIDYSLIVAVVVITFFVILLMICVLCCAIQKDKRHFCHSCAGKRKKLSLSTEHDPQNDCCMGDNCRQNCFENNLNAQSQVNIAEGEECNCCLSGGGYHQSTHSNQIMQSNQCSAQCSDSCAIGAIQCSEISLPVRNNSDFYRDQIPRNTSEQQQQQQQQVEVGCQECAC